MRQPSLASRQVRGDVSRDRTMNRSPWYALNMHTIHEMKVRNPISTSSVMPMPKPAKCPTP